MNKEDAINFILSKIESGEVVKIGYVYSLLDKIFEENKKIIMHSMLGKSEIGKDGLTVIKSKYVYSLINELLEGV